MEERFDNKYRKCNIWFTAKLASLLVLEYVNSGITIFIQCKISDYENLCVSLIYVPHIHTKENHFLIV